MKLNQTTVKYNYTAYIYKLGTTYNIL